MQSSQNPGSGEVTRIGRFEIVGLLGRGGMGVVYRGVDKDLNREVAIKTLTGNICNDPDMLARFYSEGRKTGSFKHPNIVTVYELGDDNGVPYIAMELVEGTPLDKLIRPDQPPPLIECLRIVEELCSALTYAHRRNVIHRDVKPANIFVQPDGRVKLLDFGIARLAENRSQELNLTRPGVVIGTLDYMAPERLEGKPLDGRSDIFAAGVVLYQLVCGALPFAGEDYVVMNRIMNEPHPPLSGRRKEFPPAYDAVIDRALAKAPGDRYGTAEELAAELATMIADIEHEQALQLLPEAKRLMEAQDLIRARALLLQLTKIRTPHTAEARELLAVIQQQLTQRQRDERVMQIRAQADTLITSGELDKGLVILEEGLQIAPADTGFIKLRRRIEKEKEKQKRVSDYLRLADGARQEGDFQGAISLARKAVKVDKSNSKSFALLNSLLKEAEDAERQAEVKALLLSGRKELGSARFSEALEILEKVERLDPDNFELALLRRDADSGLQQIQRKKLVAQLEIEAAAAVSLEQLQQASHKIREAAASMPSEYALIVVLGRIDRQIREQETRRIVEETNQACLNLLPRQALALVQKRRHELPSDQHLLALEGLLTERVKQQTSEDRRDEYLSQAREALSNRLYPEAIRILEKCQQECIATGEIESLLEFARREENEHRREDLLHGRIVRAQSLIADYEFNEAVEFLKGALDENEEASLRVLLDQAIENRETLLHQADAALASAAKLTRAGKFAEAAQFLQAQLPAVRRLSRVQAAEAGLADEQLQATFRMVGRAYTILETEPAAAESTMNWVSSAMCDSTYADSISNAFKTRVRAFGDRRIGELISSCKVVLRNGDRGRACELIQEASSIVACAGPQAQSDWQAFTQQAARPGRASYRE